MFLAIDIGNTNCVFALFQRDGSVLESWRLKTDAARTSDEYAGFLHPLLRMRDMDFSDISFVLIGSVVPAADRHIGIFVKKYLSCKPVFVDAGNAKIDVRLKQERQIGADRLINAKAVIGEYPLPAVVVDFGTATTFDVIDETGAYVGGAIAPGIRLSVAALEAAAAKLPSVDVVHTESAIGKTTEDAIQSGIYWGYVGLIEGLVKRIAKDLGQDIASVVATGGLAPLFVEQVDALTAEDQMLTLKGLFLIYKDLSC